jgi:2',3'-cyclic-nucleotide 2'-phosphodiesterase (5'-nucleotidase family)
MNTRRKFLIQGSMAATALLAVRPFETFASDTFTSLSAGNSHSLLLVHSGNVGEKINKIRAFSNIALKKRKNTNVAVFNTNNNSTESAAQIKIDASVFPERDAKHQSGDYEIIYKGNIKIGVITAGASAIAGDSLETVNNLAKYLKKIKNCDLVVCLSHLGFKNQSSLDDQKLAASSKNLDIIIGSHPQNFSGGPYIALNKDKEEVIINHSSSTTDGLGKISMEFNDKKEKIRIAF